jgi:hypothetical protein
MITATSTTLKVTITTWRFDRLIYTGSSEFFSAALKNLYGSLICQGPRKIVRRGNEGHMAEQKCQHKSEYE